MHGGYWRAIYDRSLQHAVVDDLNVRGWAVWNVDYRAVGAGTQDGGGWPRTFLDIADAVDLLAVAADEHDLPTGRTVIIGHSAGGTLALWAAARHRLPDGTPGANPRVRPMAVVAQAAICDLLDGAQHRLGAGAIEELMVDGDYGLASPAALLPLGLPIYLTTTAQDSAVPPEQSIRFAKAARVEGTRSPWTSSRARGTSRTSTRDHTAGG